jgi:two-component system, chemotaxis family, chemotaxis protein CheY
MRFQLEGGGAAGQAPTPPGQGHDQEFPRPTQSDPGAPEGGRAGPAAQGAAADQSHANARRGLPSHFEARRAVRESRRGDYFETAVMPYAQAGGAAGPGVLGHEAAEAAARERELRAGGERMPRRVLLTVSDPARMAQINLLLRSAAYEVRAAFDGGQALDLLRIERADLLVLDYELKVLDGPAVLQKLHERHRGRLPVPVALLLPPERDSETVREEARRCGATGFVRLPYDPAELLECVRTAGGKD